MTDATKVTIHISLEQAKCLKEHGCFVTFLSIEDSIPVGHPVTAKKGDQETKALIIGMQKNTDGENIYVIVDMEKVQPPGK